LNPIWTRQYYCQRATDTEQLRTIANNLILLVPEGVVAMSE
jgi:hypothetical protein